MPNGITVFKKKKRSDARRIEMPFIVIMTTLVILVTLIVIVGI